MSTAMRGAVGGVITLMGILVIAFFANTFASAAINHGQVVPDSPRRDVPVVLDGQVNAHAQVGNRIFVGGDFQQVERPDGSVITQAHIFAYDINTGLLDENFRPVLNKAVLDLQTNPAGDVLYASGRFWKWDSAFPSRIAKLSADGTLDTTFQASAEALVRSIAVTNTKVFLAGNFTTVTGQPRRGLAAVDINSGAVDPGFVMNVDNTTATGQYGRGIVASSDGNTVFALHFGTQINGTTRESVAKIDVSGATASLANWQIDMTGQAGNRLCIRDMRDIAISPDNSFIVIGGQGADNPPNCDSVLRYNTGGTGVIPYTWTARMYSSVFSLAVSDVAVYAGGHFCAAPLNGAPPGGSTHNPAETGTANGCDVNNPGSSVNPSVRFPGSAVFRSQMAALNPSNGQAFSWDPGSNNQVAVYDITLIDRGLLAGHDNNRFNQKLVGRSGFFDFGAPADTTAPTVTVTAPGNGAVLSSVQTLEGTAQDNRIVADVTVRLKNITTNQWLQANGSSFAAAQANAPVTLTSTGLGTADWSVALGTTLTPGDYEIRVFGTDQLGQTTSPALVSPFRIGGTAACTVALNGNDEPVITWSEFTNAPNTQIRRDGSWLATEAPDSGTYTDSSVVAGNSYSYEVRYRPNGVRTDVACTPNSITIPTGAVDTTPPVVTFTSPTTQSPGTLDLNGTITDDLSGPNRVYIQIRNQQTREFWTGTTWTTTWSWYAANLNGNTWTAPQIDLTDPGDYRIRLWAWDNENNRSPWQDNPQPTLTITGGAVDTTPPVVTFTSPTTQSPGTLDLNGTITDDLSGPNRVYIQIRNQQTREFWTGTTWTTTWSWYAANLNGNTWTAPQIDLTDPGDYRIRLWAWDNENNRSPWQDNPQPTLTIN